MSKWERITAEGKTVYWAQRHDTVYLTVCKTEAGEWGWALRHRKAPWGPGGTNRLLREGTEPTITLAKRAAEATISIPRCVHGCRGRLLWVEDNWYCKVCGDEWHPDAFPEFVFTDEAVL